MPERRVIVTPTDFQRLARVLSSDFAAAIGPREYLDELREELQRAEVLPPDDLPSDVVTMNSTAVLCDLDTGESETYRLVYPERANIAQHRLSVLAPAGMLLLGCRVGDTVCWRGPAGVRRLRIEQVSGKAGGSSPELPWLIGAGIQPPDSSPGG